MLTKGVRFVWHPNNTNLDRSHGGSNKNMFLLIFRPRALLGPRGAVLCGTLKDTESGPPPRGL